MKKSLKLKKSTQNSKKSIIAAMLLFILMLSMSSVAFASSYTTYVTFIQPYAGACRQFDGSNIRYSATMKSDKANDSGTYTIILQRASGIWALDVGSKELKRVGYGEAKWSNVGSGEYRLYFDKTKDKVTLSSDKVIFENY